MNEFNVREIIGIIGTRSRNTQRDYYSVEDALFKIYKPGDWLCSGSCHAGGDRFAEIISKKYGIPILLFPANWQHVWTGERYEKVSKYNPKAGFERNTPIAEYSTILIACVSLNRTGGTEDTIQKFEGLGKKDKLILV